MKPMKDREDHDLAVQSFLLELRSQLLAHGPTELGRVTGSQRSLGHFQRRQKGIC